MTTLGVTSPFYGGGQVPNPCNVIYTSSTPSSNLKVRLGTMAISNSGTAYIAVAFSAGTTTWAICAGSAGAVDTLTGDSGTATPSGSNIKLAGTANQITSTAASHTVTFSLPSAITAPGSLTTTTTLTGGTGITATTGNIVATAGAVSAGTTVTGGTGVTATTGDVTSTAGNLVVSTSTKGLSLPVVTASGAASGTVNCNGRVGSVTFTSVSIASNADLTLTLGNTSIAGASTRLLFSMSGATTGSALSVKSVTPGTGTYAWVVTNGDGAAIVTSVANITFDFIVLN